MKEIVIKISEDAYDYLINTHFVENTKYIFNQSAEDRKHTMQLFEVIDAVKNGIPLPEHHGRIIDESKINKVFYNTEEAICNNIKAINTTIVHTDAPTIIEADKESKE